MATESIQASPSKLKKLDYLQAIISRMAQNSFLFKGWAITLASGLTVYGATQGKYKLLLIPALTTILFWGMDGYYLRLERSFVKLYDETVDTAEQDITLKLKPSNSRPFVDWIKASRRPHLVVFYGAIVVLLILGYCILKKGA